MAQVDLAPFDLLIKEELLTSRRYRTFSEQFPQRKAFWETVSRQGEEHAAWLRRLRERYCRSQMSVETGRTRVQTILTFSAYLKGMIGESSDDRVELSQAADMAKESERSLVVEEVLGHIDSYGDDEEVSNVLDILCHDPTEHVGKVARLEDRATKH